MVKSGKIVILGAGHVGSHVARALAAGGTGSEIVLVDKIMEKAKAQAMDIADALTFPSIAVPVRQGTCADCRDAEITVIAIGKPREPGQTRLDLLDDSVRMVKELAESLKQTGVGGMVITITNPCDIITEVVRRELSMDRFRCFGTGTLLDTARLIRVLSEMTGVARDSISAYVMGEHGDSSMIPFSQIRIGGLSPDSSPYYDSDLALERTHGIGMDIIEGKGSTEFGIGQAAAWLIASILSNKHIVLPLSVHLSGEYGLEGLSCGVPCRIGQNGIEAIHVIQMTAEEQQALNASATVIRTYLNKAYREAFR